MGTLISIVNFLLTVYTFVIIARVFLTWTNISPYHPVAQWIYRLTEPVLAPIRSFMPQTGMLDWSPMIAMILVIIVRQVVIMVLSSI
jgi:YggT family protein